VEKLNEKLTKRLETLVSNLQKKGDKLIDENLRKTNETPRDILQEISDILQKIAAIVITQKSEKITIKSNKLKKLRNTREDWEDDYQKRRIAVRLGIPHLEFLDQFAGWGKRSTLMRELLSGFMDQKDSEFVKAIERGKKLEEQTKESTLTET